MSRTQTGYFDMELIEEHFEKVIRVQQAKYQFIKDIYEKIDWEDQ